MIAGDPAKGWTPWGRDERTEDMARKAAIIGGGVIGGGWAARFLLNGWDVGVFDPDPEAERKIAAVMANARRRCPRSRMCRCRPRGS
jgi:3-hydroxyacyl-CoA dehydrogenase